MLRKGHHVTILTSRFKKNLPKIEHPEKNLTIVRVGSNRYAFMRSVLWKGMQWAKKTDLIHTTTYNAAIPAWIL
jgi:hypothetical protein